MYLRIRSLKVSNLGKNCLQHFIQSSKKCQAARKQTIKIKKILLETHYLVARCEQAFLKLQGQLQVSLFVWYVMLKWSLEINTGINKCICAIASINLVFASHVCITIPSIKSKIMKKSAAHRKDVQLRLILAHHSSRICPKTFKKTTKKSNSSNLSPKIPILNYVQANPVKA